MHTDKVHMGMFSVTGMSRHLPFSGSAFHIYGILNSPLNYSGDN